MVLRGSDRMGKLIDAELSQAGQEALGALVREQVIDQLCGSSAAASGHGAQHDAGEIGAIPVGNSPPGLAFIDRDINRGGGL